MVGQGTGIKFGAGSQPLLEHGFAAAKPERNAQDIERLIAQRAQRRFVQGIRQDQRAIEINDKRMGIQCAVLNGVRHKCVSGADDQHKRLCNWALL